MRSHGQVIRPVEKVEEQKQGWVGKPGNNVHSFRALGCRSGWLAASTGTVNLYPLFPLVFHHGQLVVHQGGGLNTGKVLQLRSAMVVGVDCSVYCLWFLQPKGSVGLQFVGQEHREIQTRAIVFLTGELFQYYWPELCATWLLGKNRDGILL